MAWIEKILYPSLDLIDSFKEMGNGYAEGISYLENNPVNFSKEENTIIFDLTIPIDDYIKINSYDKSNNLPSFSFIHNGQQWIIPEQQSRFKNITDNILAGNNFDNFSVKIQSQAIYSSSIDIDRSYYFRYFVPVDDKVYLNDYCYCGFNCNGKQAGSLLKIKRESDEIHLSKLSYKEEHFLVIESDKKYGFDEIHKICHSVLLAFGFLSGKFHLNETYIVVSDDESFQEPVGLYYKSLRETITGQYSIFTTNAYSVLKSIAVKKNNKDVEAEMLKLIDKEWGCKIDYFPEKVFSNMVNLFYKHDKIARAALLTLSASRLGLEIQSAVFCVAFEAVTSVKLEINEEKATHVIDEKIWEILQPALLEVINDFEGLSDNALDFAQKKVNSFNQPTNKDKLTLPFTKVGYELSKDEKKAIKDRNKFLHGSLNVGKNDDKIDKLFYTNLLLHRLICVLILKMSGFNGYIVNNIALYATDLDIETDEWGFKEI